MNWSSPEIAARLLAVPSCRRRGWLEAAGGPVLTARLPAARVGEAVRVGRDGRLAEVVAFRDRRAVLLPAGGCEGLSRGDEVWADGERFRVRWSSGLLGRVLDAHGRPVDGAPEPPAEAWLPTELEPPSPLCRRPLEQPLVTGIRVIDALFTLARGQRIGLFAGPGVGKSSLLGQLARGTEADCTVLALVGERGRELGDFLRRDLGRQGLQRSVVVCATSDRPAAERARAVPVATAIAHGFRRQGKSVLLLVDSLTRHARACREVALAAGEFPGRRGYPPSVFEGLAQLLERAGDDGRGTISAVYTVLLEGEAPDDPLAEEVRSLLDGHLVLGRQLAEAGVFPALELGESLSRLAERVSGERQRRLAREARWLWCTYQSRKMMIEAGLYQPGGDAQLDRAVRLRPALLEWMRQGREEKYSLEQSLDSLEALLREGQE